MDRFCNHGLLYFIYLFTHKYPRNILVSRKYALYIDITVIEAKYRPGARRRGRRQGRAHNHLICL